MASSGVHKLLDDEIDRLHESLEKLRSYRDRYHEADRERAMLSQKMQRSHAADISFGVSLAIGPALIGLTPAIWDRQPYPVFLMIFGVSLLIGGIIFRMKQYD